MYWKNQFRNLSKTSTPKTNWEKGNGSATDCFADKPKTWVIFLVVIVIGAVLLSLLDFLDPAVTQAPPPRQLLPIHNVAFTPCPYCEGVLDSLGVCNFSDCPLYRPSFGR
ncbi:MAG: hypothetical protein KAS70_06890 [Planctomycetes bacterium]|nr:hypothetical protein [Planctomycetota bacterium]